MTAKVQIKARKINNEVYQQLLQAGYTELAARVVAGRSLPPGLPAVTGLQPSLAWLDNPMLMADMEQAVTRVMQAVTKGEIIALETDHDCDGQTSLAVLFTALTQILQVPEQLIQPFIGHRMTEGYGLSPALADRILSADPAPNLVITADNGSSDEAQIARLAAAGIDVIVTDHHALPADGPPASAVAVLNPTRADCQFPDPFIAGCMVAWLLMAATRGRMIEHDLLPKNAPSMAQILDFVAVGTVADCVSIARSKNNRAVVRYGLTKINQCARPCWQAIRPLLSRPSFNEQDLGFTVGPLLNSDGRLSDAFSSVSFLLAQDLKEASPWVDKLWQCNQQRKAIQKELTEQAKQKAEGQVAAGRWSLVIMLEAGHAGVHGICASRIKDHWGRPAILFSYKEGEDDVISGSARSIDALPMRECLQWVCDHYPGLLVKFGGHKGAAGLTIKACDFDQFAQAFEQAVRQFITIADIGPVLWTDGEASPDDLHLECLDQLARLGPYGREFEPPLFVGNFVLRQMRLVGADKTHAQLTLKATNHQIIKAIWFSACEPGEQLAWDEGQQLRLVYQLSDNFFREQRSLQLVVRHAVG